MTTWGTPGDYMHFLPRILELASAPEGRGSPGLDLGVIVEKLEMAGWTSWPAAERDAVRGLFEALWLATLTHDPTQGGGPACDEVLPAIARLCGDLTEPLALWGLDPSLAASLLLAEFVEHHWDEIAKTGRLQGPWREVPQRDEIHRWLTDPARRQSLEKAFEHHFETPFAERLAEAVDAWGWMTAGSR